MHVNHVRENELFVRCIICGDSQKNLQKAHLSLNMSNGLYYCYRCKAGGRVDHQLLFQLQLNSSDFPGLSYHTQEPLPEIVAGPGSTRRSLLSRYHPWDLDGDIFYSWWQQTHVGYYWRTETTKRLWGFAGTNWPGAPEPLISSPSEPLYFVEGPYDVLTERDVCFFGIPSFKKIRMFYQEHYFVLVPDGDLWTSQARFMILKSLIDQLIRENFGFMGVLYLAKNQDPDDSKGTIIPTSYFKEQLWKNVSLSSRAQQELAKAL